jgi:hypothetical protein
MSPFYFYYLPFHLTIFAIQIFPIFTNLPYHCLTTLLISAFYRITVSPYYRFTVFTQILEDTDTDCKSLSLTADQIVQLHDSLTVQMSTLHRLIFVFISVFACFV